MIKSTDKIKRLNAFTLTEVLITMFVIMLLIIASAPMITKKNIKNKAPHGVWECYLNENGEHVSKRTINGVEEGEHVEGSNCLFKPQTNAQKYTVTVIGGGGGGASGTSFAIDASSYGKSTAFTAKVAGDYKILVVGGGGGGSASIKSYGNKGGGAGGVESRTIHMNKGDLAVLEAGMGGVSGGSEDPDAESNEEDPDASCTGTSWKEICNGKDGKSSKFYIYGDYSDPIEAEGGKGGQQNSAGDAGSPACGTKAKGSFSQGGRVFTDGNCTLTQEYLAAAHAQGSNNIAFGHGGNGSMTADAYPGRNGVVLLISDNHHSGGGGKRGATAFTTIDKLTDEVKVYVGQGGAGAVYEDTNGEQGENSSFGYYISAKGGEGGTTRLESSNSETMGVAGGQGGVSPYGGFLAGGSASCNAESLNGTNNMGTDAPEELTRDDIEKLGITKAGEKQYGAGGGGGVAYSSTAENCNLERKWGKGGRGMPGYVRVEWN